MKMVFEQGKQLRFLPIADDQIGPARAHHFGLALGVAAGDDHRGLRIDASGAAHGLARIRISCGSHRTGIDHVDVGAGGEGDNLTPATIELCLESFEFTKIEFTADIAEGNALASDREFGSRMRIAMRI